ncbi:multidrug effflux MFS transporter [Stackebrandtia nassauensis]|uniref:Drug resistance transporter, Bcr/CflA subfamily n=1 Tax=Stackebrandtia nassauensis (strain DSM 44728 / CIP 108903 / NRRL B-16338 / NBRC 102104 / LLR-40K-21) TaxID=446470 RepID=D3PYQ3_STANL|nr:multidrug effflux MFS transporter [Stackebrandtia nassauensis]ADD43486.1 drug resistance transporter, Bcr/CflA subfamily [Stackebrandtia nassauensis DSM 44728]
MSAAEAAPQSAGHPRRFVALLVLTLGVITATGPLATDLYLPAFPEIAKDLDAPQSHIQLTLTSAMFGLAVGQMIIGPMSDAFGRRRPLLIGTAIFTVASFLCVFVPSAGVFIALRFVQGAAGAAGAVIARAIVRDHFSGDAITKFFSRLVLVTMLAPMLGPILGAQLLRVGPWQVGFIVLTVVSIIGMVLVYFALPESLPASQRRATTPAALLNVVRRLIADPRFIGPALTLALVFGGLFTYISSFSFVAQEQLGATAQQYSYVFGINTLAMLGGTQINGFLIGRVGTRSRLIAGLAGSCVGVLALAILDVSGATDLVSLTIALAILMLSLGMVFPNCTSLALASQPASVAGTGSALIGTLQFGLGGAIPAAAAWTPDGRVSLASMVIVMLSAILVAVPVFALFGVRATRYAD